jgi:hypothetical protein
LIAEKIQNPLNPSGQALQGTNLEELDIIALGLLLETLLGLMADRNLHPGFVLANSRRYVFGHLGSLIFILLFSSGSTVTEKAVHLRDEGGRDLRYNY